MVARWQVAVLRNATGWISLRLGSAHPLDGKLVAAATAVLHLHSGSGAKGSINVGVTTDRIFVLPTELKGDVWSINLDQ